MKDQDAVYAADLASRKAFRGPDSWEERRGTQFQNRNCSTSGCTTRAIWMIARNSFDRGGVRYACAMCKAMKYGALEEVQL